MPLPSSQSYNVLGLRMQFLVEPDATSGKLALLRSELPPGTTIPLHSHADSEIFYLLSGSLEAYQDHLGWRTFEAGQAIAISGGAKHALRNTSQHTASTMAITGEGLYKFFAELAVPADPTSPPAPPAPEQLQQLFAVAAKYGYWLASPEDNAAIGITLG